MKRIRAVYERWPDFRERLPEVWAALRDTTVPAWSRLKRVWRIAARHLLDRPEWLSSRTESLRDIRFRRQRAERTTAAEGLHRRLHALHTIGRSSVLGASVFAVCVGLSVAVGTAIADGETTDQVRSLSGTLVTIAEVVGGAAGILFAVIVFGIQYHGEKLDKAAFLVRYLRRREGLIPIAAFTLGVVAADVVVSLISALGLPHAAVPMAILNVPLVLVVLWLVLWLLYRMTTSVSDDFVTLLTPSLTWEYDRALDEDIHHARQSKVFEEAVEDAGLEYSTVGGFTTSLDSVAPVKINLGGRGSVVDVNLTALKSLGDHLRWKSPDYDAKLCIGPGDSVDNTVALVLSAGRDDQGGRQQEIAAPNEEVVKGIRRRLRAVFRLGPARGRDVVEVLSRFEEVLVSYARHDSSEQLERGLEIQETLVKRGLARADAVTGQFSMHRDRVPDFLAGFNFFEMAKHAVASGDREKLSALLAFSCRMMGLAVEHLHPGLYHRAGEVIVAIYYRAIEWKEHADYVGDYLDNVVLMSLGAQFEYTHSPLRTDPPKIAAQMPVLMVDLAWRLELMRAALGAGRTTDAGNFQDRLFRRDEHSERRFADPHEEANVSPELREASDLLSYATLITAAWCLHIFGSQRERNDAAKAVFQRCATHLGSREHLLRLWEAVRSKFTNRPLDDPFGVTRWTRASPRRSGVSVVGVVSDAWIERGFMALMLVRPSSPKYEVPNAMRTLPPFRPQSPDAVKALSDSILGNDAVRKDLLNIEDEKRDGTVNAVVSLFAERLRLFKLDRLSAVVAAPMDDVHRARLRADIASELENDYGLRSTLAKLGGPQAEALACFLPRTRYGVWLQKDSVVRCREHPMDFAPLIARSIQEEANKWITHAAERIAAPTTAIHRFAELADAVRDTVARLRRTTKNPIIVFVPHGRRIIEAILGQRGWHLPNPRELGDNHIGDWEGCHLLRFPYIDPSSIVIVDALAFYGKITETADARLDFDITNPQEAKHDEVLRQAQSESDPTKIPETDTITVLATARYGADVGLHDPSAALRVDLDLTRIGFAMIEGASLYHRPDCTLLAGGEGKIKHTLAHRLPSDDEHRAPCELCRPDDWDEQAERELRDAITAE